MRQDAKHEDIAAKLAEKKAAQQLTAKWLKATRAVSRAGDFGYLSDNVFRGERFDTLMDREVQRAAFLVPPKLRR